MRRWIVGLMIAGWLGLAYLMLVPQTKVNVSIDLPSGGDPVATERAATQALQLINIVAPMVAVLILGGLAWLIYLYARRGKGEEPPQ